MGARDSNPAWFSFVLGMRKMASSVNVDANFGTFIVRKIGNMIKVSGLRIMDIFKIMKIGYKVRKF